MQLKELRKKSGMLQRDIAKKIGIQPSTLSGWESGRSPLPLKEKKKLAQLFKVEPDEIETPHQLSENKQSKALDGIFDAIDMLGASLDDVLNDEDLGDLKDSFIETVRNIEIFTQNAERYGRKQTRELAFQTVISLEQAKLSFLQYQRIIMESLNHHFPEDLIENLYTDQLRDQILMESEKCIDSIYQANKSLYLLTKRETKGKGTEEETTP